MDYRNKLGRALSRFDVASSELALKPCLKKIHEVVSANRNLAYVLEEIHAYSGGIPKEYAVRYDNDVSACMRLLEGMHNKKNDVSNWLALMRLSRSLVKNIRTY